MIKSVPNINILYLTSSSGLYGGSRCLLNLLQNLDSKFNPIVLLPAKDSLEEKLKDLGVEYYRINMPVIEKTCNLFKIILFFPLVVLSVLKTSLIIKNKNIKVLHTNTSLIITGAIAARLTGIKSIWHIREIITQGAIRQVLAWLIYFLSDKVIVMSDAIKISFFKERKASDKIITIYEGINEAGLAALADKNKIRKEYGFDPEMCIVGMVGRITPWKGQDDFIRAASLVLKQIPGIRFFVVGGICPQGFRQILFKNKLIRIAEKLKISDKIIFTGFREDVSDFLAAFDIFVLPSKKPEPFGRVILEAMAMAKPVVATNIGGPLEIIANNRLGVLIPPRSPENIAQAVIELVKDGKKRNEVGNAGREYVRESFKMEAFRQRIGKLYDDILN